VGVLSDRCFFRSYNLDWATDERKGGGGVGAREGGRGCGGGVLSGSFRRAVCVEIDSCDMGDRHLSHCHGFEFGDEREFLLSIVIQMGMMYIWIVCRILRVIPLC